MLEIKTTFAIEMQDAPPRLLGCFPRHLGQEGEIKEYLVLRLPHCANQKATTTETTVHIILRERERECRRYTG